MLRACFGGAGCPARVSSTGAREIRVKAYPRFNRRRDPRLQPNPGNRTRTKDQHPSPKRARSARFNVGKYYGEESAREGIQNQRGKHQQSRSRRPGVSRQPQPAEYPRDQKRH